MEEGKTRPITSHTEPQDPSNDVSQLHKVRLSPDFEALQSCEKFVQWGRESEGDGGKQIPLSLCQICSASFPDELISNYKEGEEGAREWTGVEEESASKGRAPRVSSSLEMRVNKLDTMHVISSNVYLTSEPQFLRVRRIIWEAVIRIFVIYSSTDLPVNFSCSL